MSNLIAWIGAEAERPEIAASALASRGGGGKGRAKGRVEIYRRTRFCEKGFR